ncbi:MAG: amidase family protein [Pseudomonadota bacterium]
MTEACDLSAREARALIGRRALSPVELYESCSARIDAVNPAVNAVIWEDRQAGLAQARATEVAVMRGEALGTLHGLPVALKDSRATAGQPCTNGSLIHADDPPAVADEEGIAELRAEGAVLAQRTNLPEYGAGANTVNRLFGATGNPFDTSLSSAGSSGGSAAALACGMAPLATGSDYGGSLRTPAAFCGVAGFRPSLGVVPRPAAGSLLGPWPVNGPMARDMADLRLFLAAQAFHDARDPWSFGAAVEPCAVPDLAGLRLAFSADLGCCPVDDGVAETLHTRMRMLEGTVGEVVEAVPDWPLSTDGIHDVFDVTRALSFVGSFETLVAEKRELLGRNVIDNTEAGAAYTLSDCARAEVGQAQMYRAFTAFFERHDVLIAPGASVPPFPHAENHPATVNGVAMPTYMRWLALAYVPTLCFATVAAIPCGRGPTGMPFGLQVIGPHRSDAKVLAVAEALEGFFAGHDESARPVPDLEVLAAAPAMPRPVRGAA